MTATEICTGCGQCPNSGPWVGTKGCADSDILIIGEAPGAMELVKREPFIGPAGKLLQATLLKAGLPEGMDQCFVTNAMQCRPPDSPPTTDNIRSCQSRLLEELSRKQWKIIIALGNSSTRSVLNNFNMKISNERGRVFDTPYGPLVPAYHPAAVLRAPQLYAHMLQDLRAAVDLYFRGTRRSPGRTQYAVVTEDNIETVVKGLRSKALLSADIETTGFDFLRDQVLCLAVGYAPNKVMIFPHHLLSHPVMPSLFTGGTQ